MIFLKYCCWGISAWMVFAISACSQNPEFGSEAYIVSVTGKVDDDYLRRAGEFPENWVTYGKTYSEDRHSALTQINTNNVNQLGLAWTMDLGTSRGIETTPLVVDGIMFFTGPWSKVYAMNAVNGETIWTYDPMVPAEKGEKACCDVVNRGLALYKGNVYLGTLDGRLVSIDAATGIPQWQVQTTDTSLNYSITGAPRIVKGMVIIGNGGAEFGVRGYITAYDALTGDLVWRFYTVPGDPSKPFESKAMEIAAETWAGQWWKYGGGGTAWDAIVFDPELNLIYVGTGNGSPWSRFHRSAGEGDNLFLSSILVINPDTGELVWYYQTTPGDDWDYTATQQLLMTDLEIDGVERKIIMQAPKNGFFYVLDRETGELLSAESYTYVNWASSIDLKTGRPVEAVFSRYDNEKANVSISPAPNGGHNWHPMAFNPITKLVYVPVQKNYYEYGHNPDWEYRKKGFNLAAITNPELTTRLDQHIPENMNQGELLAWDPETRESKWKVSHKSFSVNGGVMTTSGGLVFQGTADGMFVAYDASNGEVLWEYKTKGGIIAPPVTYMIEGKQYITVAAGWGGGVPSIWMRATDNLYSGTIFTFTLNGKAQYAPAIVRTAGEIIELDIDATTSDEIKLGEELYSSHCLRCHGPMGANGGSIPNLVYSTEAIFGIFSDIVLQRVFQQKGMPDFSDRLDTEEVDHIKNYIINSAQQMRKSNVPGP